MQHLILCLLWVGAALAACNPLLAIDPSNTCGDGVLNVRGKMLVNDTSTLHDVVGTEFTKADGSGSLGLALGGIPTPAKCSGCASEYMAECHVPVCLPLAGYGSADPDAAWVCSTTPATQYHNGTRIGCGRTGRGACAVMSPNPQHANGQAIGCATTINFTDMSGTYRTSCGIMAPETGSPFAGHLACWGEIDRKSGRGPGRYTSGGPTVTFPPVGHTVVYPFVQIEAVNANFFALDSSGELYHWGSTGAGKSMSPNGLGDATGNLLVPTWEDVRNVTLAGGLAPSETIAKLAHADGGATHMCLISTLKKVYCWGLNTNGQCGRGDTVTPAPFAQATEAPADPKDIVCSIRHTLISTDSGPPFLWCRGTNSNGECSADGVPTGDWVTSPGDPALPAVGITKILDITNMYRVSGLVAEINNGTSDNRAYVWGYYTDTDTHGLDPGGGTGVTAAQWVANLDGGRPPVRYRIVDYKIAGMIMDDGQLSMICPGADGGCGAGPHGSHTFLFYVPTFGRVTQLHGSGAAVCALQEDGYPLCWGENQDGEAGTQPSRTSSPRRLGFSYNMGR